MFKYLVLLLGLIFNFSVVAQNLRWSFDVTTTSSTTSTVNIYLENISSTSPENINSFSTIFYYESSLSVATSFDVSPSTINLWPNNGTSSSNLAVPGTNGSVSIPHNTFSTISVSDSRIGTPGTSIPPNSGQIHVLSINFTNQNPSSLGWLTESDEFSGLVYTNADLNEFDVIVIGPQFAPLPIKLTSFTAVKEGDRNALLDWRSSSESNSDYYGIERSVDGINWEPIAQVRAAGNSSDERTYSYLDRTLPLSRALNQIFFYRLRLVDFDGKFEYSDVRSVIFDKVETRGDIALFPNPASHLAQLDVSGLDVSDGDIHLRVTDMSGKVVLTKDILGNSVEPINVLEWNSGNYNFTVTQGEKLYNKRFIKVD